MNLKSKISGIQHIGIPTNDIEKSKAFYNIIGFDTIYETINEAANEKVAFLQLGNLVMEIYENHNAAMKNGAIDHVALDVTEIDELFSEIQKLGLNMLDNQVNYLPFWEKGVKFFTVTGPNNEKIEFCERMK